MGKNIYLKLAVANLSRDKKMYIPFTIAYVTMVSIYFMVITIMTTKGLSDVPSGDSLQQMFQIGIVVMTILTIIFMLYINSFLIKRRKKEFGLYAILGLEKRHVRKVIVWENFIISVLSVVLGIISGCIFGKLIFMLLFHSLKVSVNSRFIIPLEAFVITGILFFVIFVLTSLFNLIKVSLANPIDLLKGEHMGEKKVRFILLKTILGVALLGWAYYTALTVSSAMTALNQFMLAVLAVIAATYILFQAGSLFLLNILKRNKKFYYKANNFIAISGMFHRMKQNAAGLASICILSTMVLVTVSTCTALYLGQEDMLKVMHPNDIELRLYEPTQEELEEVTTLINSTAEKYNIIIEDLYSYHLITDTILLKNGQLSFPDENVFNSPSSLGEVQNNLRDVNFITLEDYNKITGSNETLKEKEILLLTEQGVEEENINNMVFDDYTIKAVLSGTKFIHGKNAVENQTLYIVTTNLQVANQIILTQNTNIISKSIGGIVIANVDDSGKNIELFSNEIVKKGIGDIQKTYSPKYIYRDRKEGYGLYGGLLFLGVFFTIQFLAATILIIYFKQISEGYEDKERYVILQKVGMDDKEVKKTISKQIILVFFLPLASALVHVAVARHMILKLLEAFYLYNPSLTTWCIIVTCFIFMIAYVLVYNLTAKVYYKLVKW